MSSARAARRSCMLASPISLGFVFFTIALICVATGVGIYFVNKFKDGR
ncbi:hypothetical protein CAMGR0001_1591 [Campylobacter gracilis RM3268]|uniref:Uncharacterized protein n=1 Tax=Campylobacter gracilis RM3268 TaxID=553220 RepID=C8PK40_9BACT|nr:hypothetical protein CAMGR0001_1591 [Campylobacter gracilis RM3268]